MSLPVNKKTFNVINRISKSFSMIISHFAFATTLLFRVRFTIRQIITPTFAVKASSIINLRKVKLVISQVKLITKITQTINLRKIKLNMTMKEIGKLVITMYGRVRIGFVSKAIQKASSSIIIKKVQILATPILATFYTLGNFDPDTLGTLDVLTLGDMDYTIT